MLSEGSATAGPSQGTRQGGRMISVVAVVIVAVAAVGVIYLSGYFTRGGTTGGSTSAGLTQEIPLGNGSSRLTLDNATYLAFPMPEPPGRLNPHVKGNFTTSGGPVDLLVLNATNYSRFINYFVNNPRDGNTQDLGGQNVTTIFQSAGATSGSFDVSLPAVAGNYYIVFVNRSYADTVVLTVHADLIWQLPASG